MKNQLALLSRLQTQLQTEALANLSCRLWVIKKYGRHGKNSYRTLFAAIKGLDGDVKQTLSAFFCGDESTNAQISSLSQYYPLTADINEDNALVDNKNNTDFAEIISQIEAGADNDPVENMKQFNNAWALVFEFTGLGETLYAFSKVKGGWSIKESDPVKNWVFNEGEFKKVAAEKIFTFRNTIDFVAFGNDVFIRDKANYELGLNIREGLEAKRDILADAFAAQGIVACIDDLKVAIGTNKTLLRRLVAIEETRYFEDQAFIEGMKAVINKHQFNLPSNRQGQFIIDESNVDLFLKLVNDKRFISLIKKQMVDADVVALVT